MWRLFVWVQKWSPSAEQSSHWAQPAASFFPKPCALLHTLNFTFKDIFKKEPVPLFRCIWKCQISPRLWFETASSPVMTSSGRVASKGIVEVRHDNITIFMEMFQSWFLCTSMQMWNLVISTAGSVNLIAVTLGNYSTRLWLTSNHCHFWEALSCSALQFPLMNIKRQR